MKDDVIYQLTMEDVNYVLEQNHTEDEIKYIRDKYSEEEIVDIIRHKIELDWVEAIDAVIRVRLLEKI